MATLTVVGLVLPFFGYIWGYGLLSLPAGAYCGIVLAKFHYGEYDL